MKNKKRSEGGQCTIEAAGLVATVVFSFTVTAIVPWASWIRWEIGQLTQALSACLHSTQSESACREQYRLSLSKIPGAWSIQSIAEKNGRISVELHAERIFKGLRHWRIDEPGFYHNGSGSLDSSFPSPSVLARPANVPAR
ncbi:MAG: hypothetical protein C5B49_10670 [Bdellovibrio sp.]|nr:MAG: hypothetical protein C5B49_10670 [Bdellovibrio sp.]